MNKELIKRLRDEPDSQQKKHGLGWQEMLVWHKTCIEAADALEVADKRIEHLEADNAVHDSEAKLANERIEQLVIDIRAIEIRIALLRCLLVENRETSSG